MPKQRFTEEELDLIDHAAEIATEHGYLIYKFGKQLGKIYVQFTDLRDDEDLKDNRMMPSDLKWCRPE